MKSLMWHISDAGQDLSKPGARVNAVGLSGMDQDIHGGGALPTLVVTSCMALTPMGPNWRFE